VLVLALVVIPTSGALAAELDELLVQSRESSYAAEQIISCSTPDGVRDAVVWVAQSAGEIHVGSNASQDRQIAAGNGLWTLSDNDAVVSSAAVDSVSDGPGPSYAVVDGDSITFLNRAATVHRLERDGVLRATLVFDDETRAMVASTTYTAEGDVYCERRFVSFDPEDPGYERTTASGADALISSGTTPSLPELVAGFDRLDFYEDSDGLRFGYYSDGFFSFAVFETPRVVELPDARAVNLLGASYERSFTAGQVTFVWETTAGGMALVGDLPPDLHEAVLEDLPVSGRPGIFRRLWRSLFG